ncbi:GTP pyrophosphokinase [Acinetobacter baumannii]|uniref:RelA/SpoT domain-containing protein n=1 Tax=Acinetobacter oleivorans TaxID=1148157 RepID=A0ABR9NNW2_9GAMM|nr:MULTISPECIES: RelA/SpoT domain-containing protein [Acinetobacter]MBE2166445.1 RelA/SpoT domain-containing protein [Acinetobacter oleivorans]MBN6522076.1 RelA/SpoT domain-containing protein [Acinetobacter pittii]MDA4916988.1 RelA/SpoT domain-containing protein [Acinetobacter baumannii]
MNENTFLEKWNSEEPIYKAWGDFIVSQILDSLNERGIDPNIFLKISPKVRIKDQKSLIDKAYYRNKPYTNPYDEIEDKVGIRFVVLLTEDVASICEIIKSNDLWTTFIARDFEEEKSKDPLLFSYQSMHFILRPRHEIKFNHITIPTHIPCEVQIRTLLQHAHAELTHDAVYKTTNKIKPTVLRTVAKCMALIETTDSFFVEATRDLNSGPITEFKIIERLDSLYLSKIGLHSHNQKSSLIVFDAFEKFISEELIENIELLLNQHPYLINRIKARYSTISFYQQSYVLFVYWLLENKKYVTCNEWPLERKILEYLATDIGIGLIN